MRSLKSKYHFGGPPNTPTKNRFVHLSIGGLFFLQAFGIDSNNVFGFWDWVPWFRVRIWIQKQHVKRDGEKLGFPYGEQFFWLDGWRVFGVVMWLLKSLLRIMMNIIIVVVDDDVIDVISCHILDMFYSYDCWFLHANKKG